MIRTCETCRYSREEPDAVDPSAYSCEVAARPRVMGAPGWTLIADVDDWRDRWLLEGGDGRACIEGAPDCPGWGSGDAGGGTP